MALLNWLKGHLDWILAAVSIALFAALLTYVDLGKVLDTLSHADPALVAAALLAGFIGLSLRTLRWGILVREKHNVPWSELYCIQCSGMAVSHMSPGKVLEAVKVLPLKSRGVSYSFGLISIFWERMMDVLVMFAFAFLAFPALDATARLVLTALFASVLIAALLSFRHLGRLFSLFSKLPFLGALSKAEAHNFRKRTLAGAFVVTLLAWATDAVASMLAFKSLGMSIPYLQVVSSYCTSIVVGIITFLPGGFGSTEATFVFLLKGTGYALPLLLGGVLLTRVFTLGVSLVTGFALLPQVKK